MRRMAFVLIVGVMWATSFGASAAERPNIILVLADDYGWGDVSCNNPESVFQTPHMDRMAREGVRFTNAFTPHSVCSPTRYALLTGRYAWRTRMREGVLPGYDKALIPPTRLTLASLLKKHGYATAAFGKWHVGMDWQPIDGDPGDWHWGTQTRGKGVLAAIGRRVNHNASIRNGPTDIGFDSCFVTPSNNTRVPIFVRNDRVDGNPKPDETGLMRDPRVQRDKVDDIYVAETLGFIDSHTQTRPEAPFFVYLPLNAAHGATLPPARFKGKSGDGSRGDKCLWVNESVGLILEALDTRGLTDDTLVIFTCDNGPVAPSGDNIDTKHRPAGPFRGYKTDAWDGGVRVPFLARWPGHIPAGSTSDRMLCLTDVYATFAALMGETMAEWSGEDSFNQLPAMLGKAEGVGPRGAMITQSYTGVLSIRNDGWKLIQDTKGSGGGPRTPGFEATVNGPPWEISMSQTGQLYNTQQDPYEQVDLYDDRPEKVQELRELLQKQISEGRSR